jgi:hypothetical protein
MGAEPSGITFCYIVHPGIVERRGRMVRTSDSQPEGRGFESLRGICEQDTFRSTARGSHNKQNYFRHPTPHKKNCFLNRT